MLGIRNFENMFYYFLIILYCLLFVVLAVKNLKWAIYLVVFALPSYLIRFEVAGLPMTLLEGMILILFAVWAVKKRRGGGNGFWAAKFLYIGIFIFLLSATISVFVALDSRAALGIWKAYFIEPVLFFVVFINTIRKEDCKNILSAMAGSVLVLTIVAFYQKLTGDFISNAFWAAEATRRVGGVYPYPNALALYLAPIIILLLGFWARQPLKGKKNCQNSKGELLHCHVVILFRLVIIAVGLLVVYWTGSKGALLGILAGLVFYALFYKGYKKYFITAVILMVLVGLFFIQNGKINFKGNYQVEGGDSMSVRLEMWQEGWRMLLDRPVSGAGLGGYQAVMEKYHERKYIEIYLYPHNIFLNFWSELGSLGILGILGILVWFYRVGFRIYQWSVVGGRWSVVLMATKTTIIIYGLVDVPYFKNDLSVFFWILIGLLIITSTRRKDQLGV